MNSLIRKEDLNLIPLTVESEAMDIIQFGSDVSDEIRSTSEKVLEMTVATDNGKELFTSMKKIMNKINPNEVTRLVTQEKNPFKKAFNLVFNKTNQLVSKYTDIASELGSMYASVKQSSYILEKNNTLLNEFEISSRDTLEKLGYYVEHANAELAKFSDDVNISSEEREKRSILQQKVNSLTSLGMIVEQTVSQINVMKKTNYVLYKEMFDSYDTILPTIQNKIGLNQINAQHAQMIAGVNQINEMKNKLIVSTTTDIMQSAIDATNLLDCSEDTFNSIKEARKIFDAGMEQLIQFENEKMEKIEQNLIEYKKEKGMEV